VEAAMSRQELSPSIQQQVEHSTASQALGSIQRSHSSLQDFNFPKKLGGKQNRASQSKWFPEFPWLYYNEQNDSVFCFICVQQNAKSNLRAARSKEMSFISKGLSNGKKL